MWLQMALRKTDRLGYLSSRICIGAEPLTSLAKAKATLSCYPHLKKVSEGSSPSYLLDIEGITDRFYTMQISRDGITVTLNSRSSPSYLMKEHILRSLSIVMALSEDYRADLSCMLPYIIEALNRELLPARPERQAHTNQSASDSIDAMLSRRIIGLLKECDTLNQRAKRLDSLSVDLMSRLILQRYASGYNAAKISSELGVETSAVSRSMKHLERIGYRQISGKDGTFELVKT